MVTAPTPRRTGPSGPAPSGALKGIARLLARLDGRIAPPLGGSRTGWLRGATIAHRGLHGAGEGAPLENTRAAFTAAIAASLGGECDVQATAPDADGTVDAAVFHDFTLDRLTAASGPVAAHAAAALSQIAFTGAGAGETIPLLPEILALIAGRTPLLIEVKLHATQPHEPLCQAVATALAATNGTHAVMSFDPRVPAWFATHAPHLPRGLVMSNVDTPGLTGLLRRHRAVHRARPDFLALDIRDLSDPLATIARARGLPIATWTVRTPDLAARARVHADAAIAEGAGLTSPADREP